MYIYCIWFVVGASRLAAYVQFLHVNIFKDFCNIDFGISNECLVRVGIERRESGVSESFRKLGL